MIHRGGRPNRFFFLLAALALPGAAAFASGDLSWTASVSSAIINIGFAGFAIVAALVLFVTAQFLVKALKESAQARKEAKAHAPLHASKEGNASFSIGFGLSVLFAAVALGLLFLVFLFVLTGLDLSITKSFSSLIITMGFAGFVLFVLYLVSLPLMALWEGRKKPIESVSAPAAAGLGPEAALPAPSLTRRSFLSILGWAWVTFTAASLGALSTVLRFFFPNVTFEPPLKFKAGFPDTYKIGVDERFKSSNRVWIVRNDQGFYALSTICTHLGCTPNWMQADQKFKCPCHGSGFYITGINFEGPAPRPLPRFNITMTDDGQLQIDEGVQYQYELGQWGLPGSFLDYKA